MSTTECISLILKLLVFAHLLLLGERGWCTRLTVVALVTCSRAAEALVLPPRMAASVPPSMVSARGWLLAVGAARTPADDKASLIAAVQQMEMAERTAFLDEALSELDELSASVRAIRLPLRLPSRRATLGCWARLLELSEQDAQDEQGAELRRRRFLLSLAQQSERERGVWRVERLARRQTARAVSMEEMLRRTPAGLETPCYEVVQRRGTYEVRRYEPFSVVTTDPERRVEPTGAPLQAPSLPRAGAFQALAGYLFGGNQQQEKLAMTTPVLSLPQPAADGGGAMEMAFVLPARFWAANGTGAAAEPPTPLAGSGVRLKQSGGGFLENSDLLAVCWFGGYATDGEVSRRKAALAASLADDDAFTAAVADPAKSAAVLQYNDPFTPPWLRRNEVAIPVFSRE